MRRSLSLPPCDRDVCSGVAIAFQPTQGRITAIHLDGGPDGIDGVLQHLDEWFAIFRWPSVPGDQVGDLSVVVEFEGQPVSMFDAWWEDGADEPPVVAVAAVGGRGPAGPAAAPPAAMRERLAAVYARPAARISPAVEGLPGSDRYRAMFSRYERTFHVHFIQREIRRCYARIRDDPPRISLYQASIALLYGRIELLGRTKLVLQSRLDERWSAVDGGRPVNAAKIAAIGRSVATPEVRQFSMLQLEAMEGLGLPELTGAFACFAAGLLRPYTLALINYEPDSGMVYMFAEFALLAIERDVHADRWREKLPILAALVQPFSTFYLRGATCPFLSAPPYRPDAPTSHDVRQRHDDALASMDAALAELNGNDPDQVAARLGDWLHRAYPGGVYGP